MRLDRVVRLQSIKASQASSLTNKENGPNIADCHTGMADWHNIRCLLATSIILLYTQLVVSNAAILVRTPNYVDGLSL